MMRSIRYISLNSFLFFVLMGLCLTGEAHADFTLTPGISLRVEYDDNLFLTTDDETDDFSTTVVPSISLLQESKYLRTDLRYSLEFIKYLNETYLDETEIKDIQRASVTGAVLPDNRFSVLYEASIDRVTVDDRRSETSNIVNVTNEYRGLVRPRYQYRLAPNITGEIAYQYETTQYDNPDSVIDSVTELNDVEDHDAFLQMVLAASANLNFQLETYYNWHQSDEFPDYEMWHGLAGFLWTPLSHLSLDVNAGGAITDPEEGRDNLKDSLYRISLAYRPPENWGFFTSYTKDFKTSIDDGRYKWWEF
ncbi:MAG: hypothetical protein P8Y96_13270, partial [Desulfuromonadales bacterium]